MIIESQDVQLQLSHLLQAVGIDAAEGLFEIRPLVDFLIHVLLLDRAQVGHNVIKQKVFVTLLPVKIVLGQMDGFVSQLVQLNYQDHGVV